ncbi:2913_t:CDS:2 [Funneliformis mosseae]|uniref:2913_t:CDS:1 n=1 Tax=Funneliformis mosseae TaxID=27381 RepID=A0A9N9CWS0_FUNMO|nr:2913_t:CDS:2 [Funneliformis mosseae]
MLPILRVSCTITDTTNAKPRTGTILGEAENPHRVSYPTLQTGTEVLRRRSIFDHKLLKLRPQNPSCDPMAERK